MYGTDSSCTDMPRDSNSSTAFAVASLASSTARSSK